MSQQLSEQEIIRRDKLKALQQIGVDPYPAALYPVSHYSQKSSFPTKPSAAADLRPHPSHEPSSTRPLTDAADRGRLVRDPSWRVPGDRLAFHGRVIVIKPCLDPHPWRKLTAVDEAETAQQRAG